MSQIIKFQPTPRKELQNLFYEIQEGIDIYLKLPKRKQRKRKNWDAYTDLIRLQKMIKRGYYRQMKIGDIQGWKSTISKNSKLLSKNLR